MLAMTTAKVSCLATYLASVFPSKDEFDYAFSSTIRYLVKSITAREHQSRLKAFIPNAMEVRLNVSGSGYVLLSVKLFALSILYQPLVDRFDLARRKKLYQVTEADARNVKKCLDDLSLAGQLANTKHVLRSNPSVSRKIDPEQVNEEISAVISEVTPFCRRLTNARLKFIYSSNGQEPEDFTMQLLGKAIQTYYVQIPTDNDRSWLHQMNSIKCSVENEAKNIIAHYTALKHARLINNNGDKTGKSGHTLIEMSEWQIRDHGVSYESVCDASPDGSVDESSNTQSRLSLEKILTWSYNHADATLTQALVLLTGQYDSGFSQYLRDKGEFGTTFLTTGNDDFSDSLGVNNRYVTHVANYLRLNQQTLADFLQFIGHKFYQDMMPSDSLAPSNWRTREASHAN